MNCKRRKIRTGQKEKKEERINVEIKITKGRHERKKAKQAEKLMSKRKNKEEEEKKNEKK